ncbi:MAG: SPFH domain-containing protein [Bacteroidota bacterium]
MNKQSKSNDSKPLKFINSLFNAFLAKLVLKAIGLITAGAVVLSPFCVTQVTDYELVMVHRWGKINETPVTPGLKWFWPIIDKIHRYDLRQRNIIIDDNTADTLAGGIAGIDIETRDKYHAGLTVSVYYELDRSRGKTLVEKYGADDSEEARVLIERRVEDEVRYALQNLCPQYNLGDIIKNRAAIIHNAMYLLGFQNNYLTKQTSSKNDSTLGYVINHLPEYDISIPGPMMEDERLPDLGILVRYMRLEVHTPQIYESRNNSELILLELEIEAQQEIKRAQIDSIKVGINKYNYEQLSKLGKMYFLDQWDGKLPTTLILDQNTARLFSEDALTLTTSKSENWKGN